MGLPGEFVCVKSNQGLPEGVKAEATIYHAYGKDAGKPVYFLAEQDAQQRGMDKAFKDFGAKLGIEMGDYKWGRIAMVDPKQNPLDLNSNYKLNIKLDGKGKLTECYLGNDAMLDPDFTVPIRVQDKPPELPKPRVEAGLNVALER